jgi:large subunit ribosomal protein L9
MKVILLENVPKVGHKYEVVEVASGHALNLLIPRKLARTATPQALHELESKRKGAEEKKIKEMESLSESLKKVDGKTVVLKGKANEEGHLFAGIHKDVIAEKINTEHGTSFSLEMLSCDDPIKSIGAHQVTLSDQKGEHTAHVKCIVEKEKRTE